MFADPGFADFSQEIGLAAIGATDEQITQLARVWHLIEFNVFLFRIDPIHHHPHLFFFFYLVWFCFVLFCFALFLSILVLLVLSRIWIVQRKW